MQRQQKRTQPSESTNAGSRQAAAVSDPANKSNSRAGTWGLAKAILAVAPKIEDEVPAIATRGITALNPLQQGSWLIMQNTHGWYVAQINVIFKKNGTGKGTRRSNAMGGIGPSDMGSVTYLSLKVFVEHAPGEDENQFRHEANRVAALWTHVDEKEVVYNLGLSAMEPAGGRSFALKDWAFTRFGPP